MARAEQPLLEEQIGALEQELRMLLLLPKDQPTSAM